METAKPGFSQKELHIITGQDLNSNQVKTNNRTTNYPSHILLAPLEA
jgi:hypothetical protein